MDKEFKYLGLIVAILIVAALFINWGLPGAIHPLEGATAEFSGNSIIVSAPPGGVPQSYNAFWNGGSVELITTVDAPADLEEYSKATVSITLDFGACGYGTSDSAILARGVGWFDNKIIAKVNVPPIRSYWEGGQVLEMSPWAFSCGQDYLASSNPPMKMSGSVMFSKATAPPNPCEGVACNPIDRVCEDGFIATCPTSCSGGVCSTCQPDCAGHETGPGPVTPNINIVPVMILALIFIGLFGFIAFKVWRWKR